MCFLRKGSSYSFETCTIAIGMPETSWYTEFCPLNTKESDVSAQNVFSQKQIIIQLWNLYHCNWHGWNLRVHWVLPSKYKGKWCFSPKCVFSEKDHHTALKFIPLQSACLKASGCTEFCLLNTKESDVSAQNVFSQKVIIIQLWNLYHCNWHAWNLMVHWVLSSKYKGKWCFSPKCVFSETDHHTDLKLIPLQLAWLKPQGALSFAL